MRSSAAMRSSSLARSRPAHIPSMFGPIGSRGFALSFSMDVKETGEEIVIDPDLEEKDISLSVQNGVLTIEGEKKLDYDEEKQNYHVMEAALR
jgi:HSP20 family protein